MSEEEYAMAAMQALITSGLNTGAWSDYEDLASSAFAVAEAMKAEERRRYKSRFPSASADFLDDDEPAF